MDIDYKTIDINIRPQSDKLLIEAFGPRREWASDLVEIPEALLDEKIYSFKGLMVKPEEDIGEQIGEVLLPNNVRQLYVAIRQQVFSKKNQALRLRLHFFDTASALAKIPWELAKVNGNSLSLDSRQAIVRTVDMT